MVTIERAIKDIGRLKKYRKDELLFSAQQKANGLYYVQSGEIRVFKMDEQGREVEVVRLEPGDFLGEAILFVSSVFPFFAQAVKDSKVLFFDKNKIFKKIDEEPSIAKFFLNLLARKCLILNRRIESLGLETVRQRLIQYLLLHCSGEQQCAVELKTKKVELAKILGTISETLSRNLKQMQDEGLIEVEGNKIHIKDCLKLRLELLS
ncbi:MAG: cyclic nucleotide-binding domain-containing protein [Candidatus Aminicenantes bacterium]|nr:cyclic nucleotide-binding domain-containing protein [Candidatus Aminicenantes bacterium]